MFPLLCRYPDIHMIRPLLAYWQSLASSERGAWRCRNLQVQGLPRKGRTCIWEGTPQVLRIRICICVEIRFRWRQATSTCVRADDWRTPRALGPRNPPTTSS